jgi:hypothetical protein
MTVIATRAEVDDARTLRLAVPCDLPPGPVDVVIQVPATPQDGELPADLAAAVASLRLLTDDELWRAARGHLAAEATARLEELHFRQQRAETTDAERAEMTALTGQYEWAMLIRAKAIEQLLARGHDVSGLLVS